MSYGLGVNIVMLVTAFWQVLIGIFKSGIDLSSSRAGWLAAGALIIFIGGLVWMVRKARSARALLAGIA